MSIEFKNEICYNFFYQINNEIAAGTHYDFYYINELKNQYLTSEAKNLMNYPLDSNITLYDEWPLIFPSLTKMRLIYLINLIEGFFKEYIRFKLSGKNETEIKNELKEIANDWQGRESNPHKRKTSYMNIQYSIFVLEEKFGIQFTEFYQEKKYFLEAGTLRNCITHHQSYIKDTNMLDALRETSNMLSLELNVGSKVEISQNLLWAYIGSARQLIEICDRAS